MLKKPNSILSFICSFISLANILDYLLWPRTIKANESFEGEIQIKIIAGMIFLLFSIYFRMRGKQIEKANGWTKFSGILNIIIISIFSLRYDGYVMTVTSHET